MVFLIAARVQGGWQGPPQAQAESVAVSEVEYLTLGSFEKH